MPDKFFLSNQKGQVLLIVVLIMVVALTVGLSVVSRTITSLRTTTEQANSQKALSAAEAGIDQALKNNANVYNSFPGSANTTYNTTIAAVSGTQAFLVNGGNPVPKDEGAYVWITPYSSNSANLWQDSNRWNGNLTIYWGLSSDVCSQNASTNTAAAILVTVITGTKANPSVARYALDSCSRANNFTLVSPSATTISGKTLNYKTVISITNGLLVRVIPLYASTYVGASGSSALPNQGSVASSLGISDTTQRKISVFQGYPELPAELFSFSIFSP